MTWKEAIWVALYLSASRGERMRVHASPRRRQERITYVWNVSRAGRRG